MDNDKLMAYETFINGAITQAGSDWSNMFIRRRFAKFPDGVTLTTSNVTVFASFFAFCYNLTRAPMFDTSKATTVNNMFRECTGMVYVPLLDISQATNTSGMFLYCKALPTIPELDMRSSTNASNMLQYTNKMTECWLRNIKTNLQVGSGTSYGHLLTLDSLIHLIYECRDTGSQKTLTVGSANLEKLANVYVRTIEITDDMRAKDDLVDEKLPFEVCESTDENAMLIIEYAAEKNWSIA